MVDNDFSDALVDNIAKTDMIDINHFLESG